MVGGDVGVDVAANMGAVIVSEPGAVIGSEPGAVATGVTAQRRGNEAPPGRYRSRF